MSKIKLVRDLVGWNHRRLTTRELRENLAEALTYTSRSQGAIVLTKNGEDRAALVSLEDLFILDIIGDLAGIKSQLRGAFDVNMLRLALKQGLEHKEYRIPLNEAKTNTEKLAARLCRIRQEFDIAWKKVVGIARGGIYPAGWVADLLALPYQEIEIKSYHGRTKDSDPPEVKKALEGSERGDGLLVIDDIVDTGDTASCVQEMLPLADFATLYAKPFGIKKVQERNKRYIFVEETAQDLWLVFPWEEPDWNEPEPASVREFRSAA